jgi:MFS family permease
MLTVSLGLLLAGCLMAALSTDLTVLIAGRVPGRRQAIQALAMGFYHKVTGRERPRRRAMSMIVSAMGLGAVIGYLLGGVIWKTAAIGALCSGSWLTASALDLILTFACIKETKRRERCASGLRGAV